MFPIQVCQQPAKSADTGPPNFPRGCPRISPRARRALGLPVRQLPRRSLAALPEHPDSHRPERPILLAVDQELGEGAALQVALDLTDPVGSVEVGEHQDVEKLGAGSRTEGVKAFPDAVLKLVGSHQARSLWREVELGRRR